MARSEKILESPADACRLRPRPTRVVGLTLLVVAVVMTSAACGSDSSGAVPTTVAADHPVALLAEPDGSMLYAERLSGLVRRLRPDGALDPEPVARVDVVGSESDQRGLLGLTRLPDGTLVGAWVRAEDSRMVVGRLGVGDAPLVWLGPQSSDLANGGHLATAPDGTLVIGIGDLQEDRALTDDPSVPNRKLLALDPAGQPDQRPRILSSGWNNPFAFTFDTDGILWVADNTPGDQPERIGRGDRPAAEATDIDTASAGEAAPSALVPLGPGRLGRCGFLTGRLDEVDVSDPDGEARLTGAAVVAPCRTGAAMLADGRIVTASDDGLSVFPRR